MESRNFAGARPVWVLGVAGRSRQDCRRRRFNLVSQSGRNRDGIKGSIGKLADAHDGEVSNSDVLDGTGFEAPETNLIGQGTGPLLFHQEMKFHEILETQGPPEIAGSVDPGKAQRRIMAGHDDRMSQGTEERVFDGFHIAIEIREMNDPSEVRFVELDATCDLELVRHGLTVPRNGAISPVKFHARLIPCP